MNISAQSLKALSKKTDSTFSIGQNYHPDCIGLELENEFSERTSLENLPCPANWRLTHDHSLRGCGVEYVSTPMLESDLFYSLDYLVNRLGKRSVSNSIRTSTHVHLNVSDLSMLDVLKIAVLYWILEPFLSEFAGKNRKGNLFCLRLEDAKDTAFLLKSLLSSMSLKDHALFSEQARYSSVNFAALKKFGTIEFRLMRGTFDTDLIKTWVRTLTTIKRKSLSFDNLSVLKDYFLEVPAASFPSLVLGEELTTSYRNLNIEHTEVLVRRGFSHVEDVLYLLDTWDFKNLLVDLERKRQEALHKFSLKPSVYADYTAFEEIYAQDVFGLGHRYVLTEDEV